MRCSPARRRAHPVLRWTTALALAMWLPGSAAAAPPERSTVYVANSGSESVSAIDVATGSVRATIALGEQVGGTAMAVAADGQRAFIADAARDRVRLWDLRRRAVAASIPVQAPRTIVLPPDGQAVFVLSDTDAGAELLILDPADLAVRHRVALGGNAELRLDTKGAILLADVVHRDQSAAVFRIDPASGTVLGFTAVDAPVQRVIPSADGRTLFALRTRPDLFRSTPPVTVIEVIDSANREVSRRIPVTDSCGLVRISPDDRFAFVGLGADRVQQIDLERGIVTGAYRVNGTYRDAGFSPGGDRLHVFTEAGFSILGLADNRRIAQQVTGRPPRAIAAGSDGRSWIGLAGRVALAAPTAGQTGGPPAATSGPSLRVAGTVTDLAVLPRERRLFVLTESSLSAFDTDTLLPLAQSTEGIPSDLAASPDGRLLYVLQGNRGTVDVLDTEQERLLATIPPLGSTAGPAVACSVAVAADGSLAFIAYRDEWETGGWIAVVDTERHAILETIPMVGGMQGLSPARIVPAPDGRRLFVLLTNDDIAILDLAARSFETRIPLTAEGDHPFARDLAVSPDGRLLFATMQEPYGSPYLRQIDTVTGVSQVVPLDDPRPSSVVVSADNARVFVLQQDTPSSVLSIREASTLTETAQVPLPSGFSGIRKGCQLALGPDEKTAYVTLEARDEVVVVDLPGRRVTAHVPVGRAPRGLVRVDHRRAGRASVQVEPAVDVE